MTHTDSYEALDLLHASYHENSRQKGFVDLHERLDALVAVLQTGGTVEADPELGSYLQLVEAGNELMLIVTELGEAHEQLRTSPFPINQTYYVDESGNPTLDRFSSDGTIRKPEGYPSELADVEIRLGDTSGRRKVSIGSEARGKAEYNATRARRHGGKKF